MGYPFSINGNSDEVPLLTPAETPAADAGPLWFGDVSASTLTVGGTETVDGTEYVLVWKRGLDNNVFLYEAATLKYRGELVAVELHPRKVLVVGDRFVSHALLASAGWPAEPAQRTLACPPSTGMS